MSDKYVLYKPDKKTVIFQCESREEMREYLHCTEQQFKERLDRTVRNLIRDDYRPQVPVLVKEYGIKQKTYSIPEEVWKQWEKVRRTLMLAGEDRLQRIRLKPAMKTTAGGEKCTERS